MANDDATAAGPEHNSYLSLCLAPDYGCLALLSHLLPPLPQRQQSTIRLPELIAFRHYLKISGEEDDW